MSFLTEERKSLILGTVVWAASAALGVLAALWIVAALIVGSVALVHWIGAFA